MIGHKRKAAITVVLGAALAWAALPLQSDEPAAQTPKGLDEPVVDAKPSGPPGERWALLIGVNKNPAMTELHYCGKDMRVLRDSLINHCGYQADHVSLLCDSEEDKAAAGKDSVVIQFAPTKSKMFVQINDFLAQAKPEDTVLFAFSGHGKSDENGHTYLIPSDGEPRFLDDTAISMAKVDAWLKKCPAKQKVVILDACHAGGEKGEKGDTADSIDVTKLPATEGVVHLFSCGGKETSWEDDQLKHGVFTYYLTRGLEGQADVRPYGDEDGLVSVTELHTFTHAKVTKWITDKKKHKKQEPRIRAELSGKIILAVRNVPEVKKPLSADQSAKPISAEQIPGRLTELASHRKISNSLATSAKVWLKFDPSFAPARDVQLLAGLLAQQAIDEKQFIALAGHKISQLTSRAAAEASIAKRRVCGVVIGIDDYGDRYQLRFAASDARSFHQLLVKESGLRVDPHDFTLLLNGGATHETVPAAIQKARSQVKEHDLLVVYFAGQGFGAAGEDIRSESSGGWVLSGEKVETSEPIAPAEHRGLGEPEIGLSMLALEIELTRCQGNVLVVSDACHARLRFQRDPSFQRDPNCARLFIGQTLAVENATEKGGYLSLSIARALSGAADRETPRDMSEEIADRAVPTGHSDGLVTLRELVDYLRLHDMSTSTTIEGRFGAEDIVLSRSRFKVE